MRFLSAQEGERSHSQPLVTSAITASCLAFFPFQMLMQYLYYGGTESMEIPTTDILEVSVYFSVLLSALGCKWFERKNLGTNNTLSIQEYT